MRTDATDSRILADELTKAHPSLDADEQRLVIALYWLLAQGEPVTSEALSERTGVPDAQVLSSWRSWGPGIQRDEQGRVVAVRGLTLKPTRHQMEIDGRTLYAWCAFDTLQFPALLDRSLVVRTSCPETSTSISLTVDTRGPSEVSPPSAVMSLRPARYLAGDDPIGSFCNHVNFFATEQAAQAWSARNPETAVVPIAETFEVARLHNLAVFESVMGGEVR